MPKTLISPEYWQQAIRALSKRDPVMRQIIRSYQGEFLTLKDDAFFTLARAIAGQQISVKAAESVWKKLEAQLEKVTHQNVLASHHEALRAAGLSAQKVTYLQHLSEHFAGKKRGRAYWAKMSDDEVMAELIGIKGIGKWTAEMFLIFHLARPDVFPIDDIGVQKAIKRHYGTQHTKASMGALAEAWRPWRTVATWYLWRALDPVPVEY